MSLRAPLAAPLSLLCLWLAACSGAVPDAGATGMGAGTEGRDWVSGEPSAPPPYVRSVVRVRDHLRIAMRDGIELDARLFQPELPDGPGPCILVANGYGNDTGAGAMWDPWFFDVASMGFALLHVSLRGSGESEGTNDLYAHYGRDGHDLVEWMADQPWCDGRVGMIGESLLGISQWLTAAEAPEHLAAIAPVTACGDCYSVLWYPGGMLPGPGREERKGLPVDGVENEYATAIQHRDLDDWWRERVTLAEDHQAMAERGLAAFVTAGFQDYVSAASLRAYREYGGANAPKRLIVGPWPHSLGSPPVVRQLVVEFMGHRLRGDAGADARAKVLLFVSGPDRWRREADWPLPDEQRVRFHLDGGPSGSISSAHDGSLALAEAGPGEPGEQEAPAATLSYSPESGPFLPAMLGRTGRPTPRPDPLVDEAADLDHRSPGEAHRGHRPPAALAPARIVGSRRGPGGEPGRRRPRRQLRARLRGLPEPAALRSLPAAPADAERRRPLRVRAVPGLARLPGGPPDPPHPGGRRDAGSRADLAPGPGQAPPGLRAAHPPGGGDALLAGAAGDRGRGGPLRSLSPRGPQAAPGGPDEPG